MRILFFRRILILKSAEVLMIFFTAEVLISLSLSRVINCSVYREDLYLPLIRAIKQQSHKNTLCFLGSTRQFTKPSFFHMLEQNGLGYKKLPVGLLESSVLDESIGIFIIYTL